LVKQTCFSLPSALRVSKKVKGSARPSPLFFFSSFLSSTVGRKLDEKRKPWERFSFPERQRAR